MKEYQIITQNKNVPTSSQNKIRRLEYLDFLRGVMMILVIFSHFIYYCLPFETSSLINDINHVFLVFRMPLFFFISGFFIYSNKYNNELIKKRTKNRLISQLYPTLLISAIFVVVFCDFNFGGMYFSDVKYGYWFTFSIVEMFFITLPILVILSGNNWVARQNHSLIVVIYGILVYLLVYLSNRFLPTSVTDALGFVHIHWYFPFFVLGMLFKINYEYLIKILDNKYLALISFVGFVIAFRYFHFTYAKMIEAVLAFIFIHYLTYNLFKNKIISETFFMKSLIFIGTMTLEIYLLHYFVINILSKFNLNVLLFDYKDSFWIFFAVMLSSFLIAYICISFVNLLKISKLSPFIFPKKK